MIGIFFGIILTTYSMVRSVQCWRKKGLPLHICSILFAVLAVCMAKCTWHEILELLR